MRRGTSLINGQSSKYSTKNLVSLDTDDKISPYNISNRLSDRENAQIYEKKKFRLSSRSKTSKNGSKGEINFNANKI